MRSVVLVGLAACASAFHVNPGALVNQRHALRQVRLRSRSCCEPAPRRSHRVPSLHSSRICAPRNIPAKTLPLPPSLPLFLPLPQLLTPPLLSLPLTMPPPLPPPLHTLPLPLMMPF